MLGINFKLLCEQVLFEAQYNDEFRQLATDSEAELTKYKTNKAKDPQNALTEYNQFRMSARRGLERILIGRPVLPGNKPIKTAKDVDWYITSASCKMFPSLRHLTSHALPQS